MTNYREILRLQSLGLNNSQIADACGYSRTTVIKVLDLARANHLSYPLPEGMSDKQLAELYSIWNGRLVNAWRSRFSLMN